MQELLFLHSARRLMLIDICMKFREDSFRGFQVTERTRFVTDRQTDRQKDRRTPGEKQFVSQPFRGRHKKWQHCIFHYNPICCHGTSSRIRPKFKLIQALMHVIVTCKYEMDPIKNSQEKVGNTVSPIIILWGFFQTLKGS